MPGRHRAVEVVVWHEARLDGRTETHGTTHVLALERVEQRRLPLGVHEVAAAVAEPVEGAADGHRGPRVVGHGVDGGLDGVGPGVGALDVSNRARLSVGFPLLGSMVRAYKDDFDGLARLRIAAATGEWS